MLCLLISYLAVDSIRHSIFDPRISHYCNVVPPGTTLPPLRGGHLLIHSLLKLLTSSWVFWFPPVLRYAGSCHTSATIQCVWVSRSRHKDAIPRDLPLHLPESKAGLRLRLPSSTLGTHSIRLPGPASALVFHTATRGTGDIVGARESGTPLGNLVRPSDPDVVRLAQYQDVLP